MRPHRGKSAKFAAALVAGGLIAGGSPGSAGAEPDTACAVAVPTDEVPTPTAEQADYRSRLHAQATGDGVTVAVIDTGVHPHPQLRRVAPGRDFVDAEEPNPLKDCDGHGTVVAGVIAAADTGVAPGARLLSIRQTSAHYRAAGRENEPEGSTSGTGNLDTLAAAIESAVEEEADVINVSVVSCLPSGTAVDTGRLDAALEHAESAGTVVVAAAGNAGPDCEPGYTVYPAHAETVVSVGALADPRVRADYSIPPPEDGLALTAPGSVPLGLSPGGQGWTRAVVAADGTGQQRQFTGTSFAAPTVTGTAALLREIYPDADAADIRALLAQGAEPSHGGVDPLATISARPADYVEDERELAVTASEDPVRPATRRAQLVLLGLACASLVATLAGATLRRGRAQ